MDSIPDNVRINGKVHMHGSVTQRAQQVPRHFGVQVLDLLRDVMRRFPDNDEV